MKVFIILALFLNLSYSAEIKRITIDKASKVMTMYKLEAVDTVSDIDDDDLDCPTLVVKLGPTDVTFKKV